MAQRNVTPDDTVGRVVEMLRGFNGETKAELASATGIPLRTLSRRLNGGGHWEVGEVSAIAAHYDAPVSLFFEGPSFTARDTIHRKSADSAPLPELVAA